MRTFRHLIVVVTLVALASVGMVTQAHGPSVVQGRLVRLDASARKIVIKTETGSQMQFEYTESTTVNGAYQSVEGLGARTGTFVTVQYEKQETRMLAVQVDIDKKP
jgi:hypothetical protein